MADDSYRVPPASEAPLDETREQEEPNFWQGGVRRATVVATNYVEEFKQSPQLVGAMTLSNLNVVLLFLGFLSPW